jgi:peptidoglycan/xylan/chitin deacetylase (PgdA/CDA1 family)
MTPIRPADIGLYNGQALITFTYDDGWRNNFDIALPIHARFNMAAGFAVIAERALDSTFWGRYMGSQQVAEARRLGVEIYSHGYSHRRLNELNDDDLDLELRKSQEILSAMGDQKNKVTSICSPFSAANARVISAARKYYSSIRVHGKKFTPVFPENNDPVIYSFGLTHKTQFEDIKAIIDEAVLNKAWVTLMLHGVVDEPGAPQKPFDINVQLLVKIMEYVKILGSEKLLPVNLSDVARIRSQTPECPAKTKNSLYV